jgi:hypothetical protein
MSYAILAFIGLALFSPFRQPTYMSPFHLLFTGSLRRARGSASMVESQGNLGDASCFAEQAPDLLFSLTVNSR